MDSDPKTPDQEVEQAEEVEKGKPLTPEDLKPLKVEASSTLIDESGEHVNAPPKSEIDPDSPEVVEKKKEVESKVNLHMYFAIKRIPVTHQAGLKAFTKEKLATVEGWDEIFKDY